MNPPLDTNVIIRHITADDPALASRARAFLRQVENGTVQVDLPEAVILEAVQVLSSRATYNLPRLEVARDLATIIRLRGIRMKYKRRYIRALELYATSTLDFVDALLVAYAEHRKPPVVVSFDQDFDKIPGIQRLAP
jgi:predicted nucleic acid-binding protein